MLISPAYAQDAAGGGLALITQLAPLLLIFAVFYFLLIRPQQKKQKEHRELLSKLKRGDRVLTAGGILGKVTQVKDGVDEIEVEIAPNVRVSVLRQTIGDVLKPVGANDAGAKT
ncbi:preprotein translocase subunit YajC [Roseicella aquatilis]|uniref:Sec translocon accessory complex subunit YajC n=1 Tax=Roseicella aquatilis TaxID=2527868 RepID=A0A4R4DZ94_9PROT|nr:preprotein translocase subunit YajC [Roseicella aquatilis]TCZ66703.1 preprotein translocase subunit YajC [Roseicella aquatilis]